MAITVQCATFNAGLASGALHLDYASWLVPTLSESSTDYPQLSSAPDIYAVGFQETLPLHLSMLGFSKVLLDSREAEITETLNKATGAYYSLVQRTILGGTALFLYVKDDDKNRSPSIVSRIRDVAVSSAGIGPLWLVNKAAVGIRLTIENNNSNNLETFTFVCAHLTAHEHNLHYRNIDWKSIVSRLLFRSKHHQQLTNIYQTSHLFVLGDFNYRVDRKHPTYIPARDLVTAAHEDYTAKLLPRDQLNDQLKKGNTFHHLFEGDITFKPSYKFEPGSVDIYHKIEKRTPSWCDRILFASWADTENEASAQVVLYRSIMGVTVSDHKPVTAIISLPKSTSSSQLVLKRKPTIPHDPLWLFKWYTGQALSKIIGLIWTSVVLLGYGDGRVGTVNFLLIILTTSWFGYWKGIVY